MAGKMNGIDVSHWQGDAGFNPAIMPADFIICKATESTSYKDKTLEKLADATLASGKLLGLYHFAKGKDGDSGKSEAEWFVKNIQKYIGKALLVLDWEADVMKKGTGYAKEFCDRVTELTGVKPIIYMSTSSTTAFNWADFIKEYPFLWGAEYNANLISHGYTINPKKKNRSLGGFTEIMRQYSSNTYLTGFGGRLDVNECYIDQAQWKVFCTPTKKVEPAKEVKSETKTTPKQSITIREAAENIVAGKPGWNINGAARVAKAKSLGLDYKELQAEINKIIAEKNAKKTTSKQEDSNAVYYTVKRGDTGTKIAKANQTTLLNLRKLNPNISNFSKIQAGQKIRIK